jgi:RNA polymerase sigma-70 factor (ECF subfamily)
MADAVITGWEDGLSAETEHVARLRRGDLNSLTELIPLYQHRLYRYLTRLVRDSAAADDLFQETWLRVTERIRHYSPNRSFDHWLFAVAHNLAIDYLRRRQPEALVEEHMSDKSQEMTGLDQLLNSERAAMVASAINELSAACREVVTLRFEEGLKIEEIASVIGVPLPTVKTRLRRSLENLRKRFQ